MCPWTPGCNKDSWGIKFQTAAAGVNAMDRSQNHSRALNWKGANLGLNLQCVDLIATSCSMSMSCCLLDILHLLILKIVMEIHMEVFMGVVRAFDARVWWYQKQQIPGGKLDSRLGLSDHHNFFPVWFFFLVKKHFATSNATFTIPQRTFLYDCTLI